MPLTVLQELQYCHKSTPTDQMHRQTVIPTGIEPLISKGCSLLVNRCAVMQMQTDVNAEK